MLEKSKRELNDAKRCFEYMKQSNKFDDFEIAWINFLGAIYKIFNKAENEIKRNILNESVRERFLSKYKSEIKKDPMLSYLKNVRGASEHTISEIAQEETGIVIGHAASPITVINKLVVKNGKILEADIPAGSIIAYKKPILIGVENRGVLYDVPRKHLGREINTGPLEISLLAIEYYEMFLRNAEEFIEKNINI